MGAIRIHSLNVKNGACSIIQHGNNNVTMFDVNCAKKLVLNESIKMSAAAYEKGWQPVGGNYQQKYENDNPIDYLTKIGVEKIFRFIVTHPDMDHLGGVQDLFETFPVINVWDTANTKEFKPGEFNTRPRQNADWQFYKNLRDTNPQTAPRRLVLHSGDTRDYYKGQGLSILAPTPELITRANRIRKWNDASYVVLYRVQNPDRKILFTGDSENETWKHLIDNWGEEISNVDILVAPHHGRDSDRDYSFLSVVNPTLTLFGNALSKDQGYQAFNNRGLTILTNNQAGYIVLEHTTNGIEVYVKNETYANNVTQKNGWATFFSENHDGWYIGSV